ncbi:ribonucleases P/MRP protein subunit POP1 [Scaptodrosophila lebanonensis]|uniref:Ribonucleases P/MRP protein subunit POP1 n=1 Tax=Drosophila lebanonensis TaxID=7225 RepID=A0A6J2TWR8_DROLE|nr:ribonucleases P/MRP protein subunit POP1 [Scaptodrosophila lebanonensis]
MSNQKLEYDAALGGRVTLPTHIPTYHYAAGALREIKSLIADAQQTRSTKLIFQSLPKHMRRRAMSHHPKRLPRKYRSAHKSQMGKSGNTAAIKKRPSRKYRRRPKNLMREYLRRQRRHIWLETHIWHAKRFHMVDRWGYKLPYASCDKTYRACYRASAQHCLVQDISFYCCVELQGNIDLLCAGFARLTSSECGLSIGAKTYLSGRREGSIELFRDGKYPAGALQRASFMWRPITDVNSDKRTLWLWLHPCGATTTIEELVQVFDLKSTKHKKLPLSGEKLSTEDNKEQPTKEETKESKQSNTKEQPLRFWTQTKAFELNRHYANADGTLELLVLKNSFNRFRLTGPRSQEVLANSLRAYQIRETTNSNEPDHWLSQLDSEQRRIHETQANYCRSALRLNTPSELLSNMVLGLNIVDPRLQRPIKRTKAGVVEAAPKGSKPAQLLMDAPACLPTSALWDKELRERLGNKMLSIHDYCQLRQKHAVVPGMPCAFEQSMQPLPVLLVQRPGSQQPRYKRLGYGCGWDIIAPARYGLVLWLTLIMWGARPGGLREFDTVAREAGAELHLPDTVAGVEQAATAAADRRARYFRLPPNKRCNYRKYAVVSPFSAPFGQLVRDWRQETDDSANQFFVLRQRDLLQRIDTSLRRKQKLPGPKELPAGCLVQVQLRLLRRGSLHENAIICLPTRADLKRRLKQLKRDDQAPVYCEPPLPDLNERPRRDLRLAHKRLLKRLRGRRVREKRKLQETSTQRVHIRAANTAALVREHFAEMCRLWLPMEPAATTNSVRRQCTREVFGYVTSASFSFTEATVCAVGYVTAGGLRQLLSDGQQSPLCLVRDPDSRDYRFSSLKVNLDVSMP